MWEKIEDWYYTLVPYEFRVHNLWYDFKCWAWHRYTTVKPRTIPYHTWVDKDHLLVHCNFEILSRFMEDEIKGYKEEDYNWYYTEQIPFGGTLKDPYYVLDYLYRWWKFFIEKEEKLGDGWHAFNKLHCEHQFNPIENTQLLSWDSVYDSPENKVISNKMFKRYTKKSEALEQELEDNLILLIKMRKFLWT